uniref:PARP catalytic domain-containing protein n=1 Tax=Arundo donax TaxID=35708 RepID=A0A0A9GX92_ARUDO
MLLCRAILGNMGTIKTGSQDEFPSTRIYDSGADNCSNPSYYLIWTSHLSMHICLEYLISFRLAPKVQAYLGEKGLWFHSPRKQSVVDLSTLQPIICKSSEGPTSPWTTFKVLFDTIQGSISPVARELLFLHHEELKKNKITREEMVKKMMIIVGEKMLVDSLTKLKCSPSLWYKSIAKVATRSVNTAVDSICIDTTSRNAPSATIGHDSVAPSVVPVKSEPIDSNCEGSPQVSVALKQQDFPQNSSPHCPERHGPVPIMVPTVHTSALR